MSQKRRVVTIHSTFVAVAEHFHLISRMFISKTAPEKRLRAGHNSPCPLSICPPFPNVAKIKASVP